MLRAIPARHRERRSGKLQSTSTVSGTQFCRIARGASVSAERIPSTILQIFRTIHQPMTCLATRDRGQRRGSVGAPELFSGSSSGKLVPQISLVWATEVFRPSYGSAATSPVAGPRNSVDQLRDSGGLGVPDPAPRYPQKAYRFLEIYGRGGTRKECIVGRARRSGNPSRRRSGPCCLMPSPWGTVFGLMAPVIVDRADDRCSRSTKAGSRLPVKSPVIAKSPATPPLPPEEPRATLIADG